MKAIVANVLFGSILGCLSWADSACAEPQLHNSGQLEIPVAPILSAKLLSSENLPIVPQIINLVDRIFTVNKSDSFDFTIEEEAQIVFRDRFSLVLKENQGLALDRLPYSYEEEQADLVLGFQNTFWSSQKKSKYWGVTTVERWGNDDRSPKKLNLAKLNYTNLSPTLPSGNSTLTFSGGGNRNLAKETDTSREFDQFRGGISYHHGVADNVTVGTGFVYEDFLIGFTNLTYNSDRFPLKTTVSLLAKVSGLDFRSHVRFEPADNFVLNYYHDQEKDKFDANWKVISGLTLTADGDTKRNSLRTGIKMAVHSDYVSISAKASLDSENNLQWKLKSRIGGLNFTQGNDRQKSTSQIALSLVESGNLGFKCSAFVKYETTAKDEGDFMVWGSKMQSQEKITPNKHLWTVNLGYGSSSYGNGLIAAGSVALKSNVALNLTYQEISATSDDTQIKLQIGSK